jgi:molecular chaperone GrpE
MADVPLKNDDPADGEAIVEADPLADQQKRAEDAERKRDEYFSLLRQAQADYENAHQRNRREREIEQKYRSERLALDLLPALDNLDRALSAAQEAGEQGALVQGVALVRNQLLDALKKHGVTPIEALDRPFDPNYHQALTQVPAPGKPPNTVVHVAEPGYAMHDRVLRAAKVIISQPQ